MEKQLTPREQAAARNAGLKNDAARRLGSNAEFNKKNKSWYTGRKAECAPNRKAGARLKGRQADHAAMLATPQWRGNPDGYHKPGSYQ